MHDLSSESLADVVDYLKENMDLYLMVYKGNVLNVTCDRIEQTAEETAKSVLDAIEKEIKEKK